MKESEFDRFADKYDAVYEASLRAHDGIEYFAEYKVRDIAREYSRSSTVSDAALKVLDFGSGNGRLVPFISKYLPRAKLTCIDVSGRSLAIAKKRFSLLAEFVHFDGTHIPFSNHHFDIIYSSCVFHHVDETKHLALLKEMHRVLSRGGNLFVFEHNPYNPLTVYIVNSCPFDKHAQLIRGARMKQRVAEAGFVNPRLRYRIFFPHALRILRPLEAGLAWLPMGGQYYVLARK